MNTLMYIKTRDMLHDLNEDMTQDAIAGNTALWKYIMQIHDITTKIIGMYADEIAKTWEG